MRAPELNREPARNISNSDHHTHPPAKWPSPDYQYILGSEDSVCGKEKEVWPHTRAHLTGMRKEKASRSPLCGSTGEMKCPLLFGNTLLLKLAILLWRPGTSFLRDAIQPAPVKAYCQDQTLYLLPTSCAEVKAFIHSFMLNVSPEPLPCVRHHCRTASPHVGDTNLLHLGSWPFRSKV